MFETPQSDKPLPRGVKTRFSHLPWDTSDIADAISLSELTHRAGGPIIARHITTLQAQEDAWHANTDDFAAFIASMNDPIDTTPNQLVINAATFSTLVQYRIVDTALFRDKDIPIRKAVLRPELQNRLLPSLGNKLSLRPLDDIPSFVSAARSAFDLHTSTTPASETVVTTLDLALFESQPERLFSAICRRKRSRRGANMIINLEAAAFHLRYLLEGHPDLPATKKDLLNYFAKRSHAKETDMNDWADFQIKDMGELKGPLYIAMSITPLTLLMGRNLQNRPPGKDALADIRGQYQRPPSVLDAEREVWRTVWDIATGVSTNYRLDLALTNLAKIDFKDALGWSFVEDIPTPLPVATSIPISTGKLLTQSGGTTQTTISTIEAVATSNPVASNMDLHSTGAPHVYPLALAQEARSSEDDTMVATSRYNVNESSTLSDVTRNVSLSDVPDIGSNSSISVQSLSPLVSIVPPTVVSSTPAPTYGKSKATSNPALHMVDSGRTFSSTPAAQVSRPTLSTAQPIDPIVADTGSSSRSGISTTSAPIAVTNSSLIPTTESSELATNLASDITSSGPQLASTVGSLVAQSPPPIQRPTGDDEPTLAMTTSNVNRDEGIVHYLAGNVTQLPGPQSTPHTLIGGNISPAPMDEDSDWPMGLPVGSASCLPTDLDLGGGAPPSPENETDHWHADHPIAATAGSPNMDEDGPEAEDADMDEDGPEAEDEDTDEDSPEAEDEDTDEYDPEAESNGRQLRPRPSGKPEGGGPGDSGGRGSGGRGAGRGGGRGSGGRGGGRGGGGGPDGKPKPRRKPENDDQQDDDQQDDDQRSESSESEPDVQYLGTRFVKVKSINIIDLTGDTSDEATKEKQGYAHLDIHNGGPRLRSNMSTAFFMPGSNDDSILYPSAPFKEDIHFMDELHRACLRSKDLHAPSRLRTIPYPEYEMMTAKEIGDIFRRQSIVVTGVDNKETTFEKAIYSLKSIDEALVLLDQSIALPPSESEPEPLEKKKAKKKSVIVAKKKPEVKKFARSTPRHCLGTLRQVMDSVHCEHPKSINVLDIAAKADRIPENALFSDKVAWDHTPAKAGENYPTSDMRWALASSGWTQQRWHQDCNGLATVVTIQSGMKWWYIGSPREDSSISQEAGGISRFIGGFDLDESNSSRLDVEVAVLTPSDWLFLRPQTLQAVITPLPTVVNGGHFLATSTIRETCFGLYDDFIAGRFITNTNHSSATLTLLTRLLLLYHNSLLNPGRDDVMQTFIGHIPDVSTSDGVIDLFCFCNLFEIYGVLCSWQYDADDSVAAVLSRRHVIKNRKLAREIKDCYARGHLDDNFLAQQCKALLSFRMAVDKDPRSKYIVGEFDVPRDLLSTALRNCLRNNPTALAYFDDPETEVTFNWDKHYSFTVHKKALPIPRTENIDGLTYGDILYFQVPEAPVEEEPLVTPETPAVKRKRLARSDSGQGTLSASESGHKGKKRVKL
ncbi:hypothetical protein DXG01_016125 [Tephrocybe rancida]|nr:hypothetical protein DXG01_016125 [Tephrocybe rancida]